MIKPKKSGLGKQKRFFNEIESVAISLNFLKNKFQVIYDESLDLINGIVRKVKSRLLCKMLYNVFTISTYQN